MTAHRTGPAGRRGDLSPGWRQRTHTGGRHAHPDVAQNLVGEALGRAGELPGGRRRHATTQSEDDGRAGQGDPLASQDSSDQASAAAAPAGGAGLGHQLVAKKDLLLGGGRLQGIDQAAHVDRRLDDRAVAAPKWLQLPSHAHQPLTTLANLIPLHREPPDGTGDGPTAVGPDGLGRGLTPESGP